MGFELPKVFSSKPVRSAIFMVFRGHVLNGVLSSGLFPILIHPSIHAGGDDGAVRIPADRADRAVEENSI